MLTSACNLSILVDCVAGRFAQRGLHIVRGLNSDALVGLDATRRIGKLFAMLCVVLFLSQGPL
jgi:hypothetical protein